MSYVRWSLGGDKHMCLLGSFDIYLDYINNTFQTTRYLDTLTSVTEDMHCTKKNRLKIVLFYCNLSEYENSHSDITICNSGSNWNMILWYENYDTIYSFFWELDSFFASMLVYFYQMKRWGRGVVFFYKKCIEKKLFQNCLYRGWYSGLKLSEDHLTPEKEILVLHTFSWYTDGYQSPL